MKTFYTSSNVGKARHVVSFHDGVKTHNDGSAFFDLRIFSNKKNLAAFTLDLHKDGYVER